MNIKFTEKNVNELNERQQNSSVHPYTCCSDNGCVRSNENNFGILIATTEGWICPCSKYRQDWYH